MIRIIVVLAIIIGAFVMIGGERREAPIAQQQTVGEPLVIAAQLDTPWEIAFLPSGEMLIAERSGVLRMLGEPEQIIEIPGSIETAEGGFLGLALHPQFSTNNFLYLYTTRKKQGQSVNQVVRYVLRDGNLRDEAIIVDDIPAASVHNGGRIAFGPDGLLYVTTGDAGRAGSAQDLTSLAGKILRIVADGSIPAENPFGTAVYSFGHRNPQGLAWDDAGRLWSTEHGRSGASSGFDEVNHIVPGGNYGWPEIEGDEIKDGMIAPQRHSGASVTWAPASLAYHRESLYFGGLRGQTLYEVPINPDGTLGTVKEHFKRRYGRIRAVVAHDGSLYVTTSNKDGRGNPSDADDQVIKVE